MDRIDKMNRKTLSATAEELNEVLGLDPPINVRQRLKVLKSLIIQASELLEPEDAISKETKEIVDQLLSQLINEPLEKEQEETKEHGVPNEELPTPLDSTHIISGLKDNLVTPRHEETQEDFPKETNKKEEKTEAELRAKEIIEQAKEEAKEKRRTKKITRPQALAQALKNTKGQIFTTRDIVARSHMIYERATKDKSSQGAEIEWLISRGALIALGVVVKVSHTRYQFKGRSNE